MKQYLITDLDLADNILRLRKERKMTQNDVAIQLQIKGVNITRSRYSMIELKKLNVPVSMLVALQQIFRCDYQEFFRGLDAELQKLSEE